MSKKFSKIRKNHTNFSSFYIILLNINAGQQGDVR
jgi:hypothetical protein